MERQYDLQTNLSNLWYSKAFNGLNLDEKEKTNCAHNPEKRHIYPQSLLAQKSNDLKRIGR
ncbi:hypothetical protein AT1219_230001 [Vibrio alginolyticus]